MFYIHRSSAKRVFALFLILAVTAAFWPVFTESSFSATRKTSIKKVKKVKKPALQNLYVNTEVSQTGIPPKKKRRNYRRVQLTWTAKGQATGYLVYGTWNARVRHDKVEKVQQTVTKNGKKQTVTKNKTVTTFSWESQTKLLDKVTGCQSTVLAKNNKPCTFSVVPFRGRTRGSSYKVTTYEGDNNATDITLTSMTASIPERSTGTIVAASNNPLNTWVSYRSSNNAVATVTNAGVIQAKTIGNFTVIATAHNGLQRSFNGTITRMYPTKIKIAGSKKVNLESGKQITLAATAVDGTDKTIHWKSTNKKVAKVTKNGVVTAVGCGTAKIKAYGGHFPDTKAATAKVKVSVIGDAEAMVQWAEAIAKDNRFGYSMNCYRGGQDRFCYFCHGNKVSKDYDCASFVAAAVAHGLGDPAMLKYCKSSGGCTTLYNTLKKNGWKDLGKLSTGKLKRGDILVNPSAHVEIFTGKKNKLGMYLNVGAHDDYDGRSGDSTGRDISIAPTAYFNTPWHHYTHVMRLEGR